MTPKQNRGAGKKRPPAVPLNYYDLRAEQRKSDLFFVFCNGKITEKEYFTQLSKDLANKSIRSQFCYVEFVHGAPKQIVQYVHDYVTDRKRNTSKNDIENNDIVWVVFDKDDFGKNYSDAVRLAEQSHIAEQPHINVAYSNICFELWLLLHFQEQTAPITQARLTELLRRKWEEVADCTIERQKKVKHFPYGIIRSYGDRNLAMERAENLYNTATQKCPETPWEIDPVTNVYQLVKALQNFFS
ncbi:MAG: RloB family protein [Planctomycetaceae bacterium]|jgi:hypothetical protein|nr:RloB family protein [Planctomycetaceae bacterium]